MYVLLWEGNLDARLLELVPDGQQDLTAHIADAVGGILDPEAQLEFHRVVAKAREETTGFWMVEDAWGGAGGG